MYRLVERRSLWFLVSLLAILPGVIFMLWNLTSSGILLPLSIDYTGGTQWEMRFEQSVAPTDVGSVFVEAGFADTKAFLVEDDRTVQVKFKNIDISQKELIAQSIIERFGEFDERLYRSIGPAIGAEVSRAALLAVVAASILILIYIAFAFREISHPFRYGVAAIAALVHDVLITVSFLSIMNLIAGWELDALFLTATLTVIGFSVNDTIVIFDRIRENLRRHRGEPLSTVANRSIIETAQRSIATQVTALLVLSAIMIFGGFTLRIFMATLIVGLVSGTYSSIFTATPLVVAWEEGSLIARSKKPVSGGEQAVLA